MALDPVVLDDLRWTDMVESIRRRIPAASEGRWTLHAPVDPGITLLELFAWLLEQRVYWMDQVPDALVRAGLALLDEAPALTECAATVMQIAAGPAVSVVPRLAEFDLPGSQLTFSTDRSLVVLPFRRASLPGSTPADIGVRTGSDARVQDWKQGAVQLFPADGSRAHATIELRLASRIPAPAPQGRFALLFDLSTPSAAAVAPQWKPGAARGVPPPAQLSWWYRNAPGAPMVRFAATQVSDGTEGLRRSGLVRFDVPEDWCPEPDDGGGGFRYAIRITADAARFSYPPRLVRLVPNVAIARHRRRTQRHALAKSWLPIPGNVIALAALTSGTAGGVPAPDTPPLERGIQLWLREREPVEPTATRWHRWRATETLYRHGPADRVFVLDRERAEISFGDGLTGRLPLLSALGDDDDCNVRVRYWVGGGASGRIGDAREWEGPGGSKAVNVVAAEGGAASESIEAARARAGSAVRRLTRAVIGDDYKALAMSTPGVAIRRAHAAVGYHPAHPCAPVSGAVTVFIVPHAPRDSDLDRSHDDAFVAAPAPDPGALAAVGARLDSARLLTTEIFVRAPRYRAVALEVSADLDAASPLECERALHAHLARFLDPLEGGDTGDGWPFGEPLRPSVLLREAQRALGDAARAKRVAIGLDGAEPDESCRDVAIGAHELVWLQRLTARFDRSHASEGGFR